MVSVWSAEWQAGEATAVQLEIEHYRRALPQVVMTGLARAAVAESRERVLACVHGLGWSIPRGRLVFHFLPAQVPKTSAGLDLAMVMGLWLGQVQSGNGDWAAVGEVSLNGEVHVVPHQFAFVELLLGLGKKVVVPRTSVSQGVWWSRPDLVYVIDHCQQIPDIIAGKRKSLAQTHDLAQARAQDLTQHVRQRRGSDLPLSLPAELLLPLSLHILGGHHLLLFGPPGVGKTVVQRVVNWLAPPETPPQRRAQLQSDGPPTMDWITMLSPLQTRRETQQALQRYPSVLIDEWSQLPASRRESWRVYLDDHLSQAAVIATANPCPCGYYGEARCRCTTYERERYRRRFSGPILDRFCLQVRVTNLALQEITTKQWHEWQDQLVQARSRSWRRAVEGCPLQHRLYNWTHFPCDLTLISAWRQELRAWSPRRVRKLFQVATTMADWHQHAAITNGDLEQAHQLVQTSFILPGSAQGSG